MQSNVINNNETGKKYHLILELDKNIKIDQIEEKIMNISMQLSIREILAISDKIADYLHDQIRKHQISIKDQSITASTSASVSDIIIHATTVASSISSMNVNSINMKLYYTLPFDHAKIILNDQFSMNIILNNKSEINMMSKYIFEHMNLSINTEIH